MKRVLAIALFDMLVACSVAAQSGEQSSPYPAADALPNSELMGPTRQGGTDKSGTADGSSASTDSSVAKITPNGEAAGTLAGLLPGSAQITRISLGDTTSTNFTSFGAAPGLIVGVRGGLQNGIVGIVDNDSPAGSRTYPTGVTGYGNSNSAGGTAFGLFGRADLRRPGTATNEMNTFNYSGRPSTLLPPNEAAGTTENNAITLQLIPYGKFDSSIGLQWGPGTNNAGTAAIQYLYGAYMRPGAFSIYGFFVDASTTDTGTGMVIKRGSTGQHINLISLGAPQPDSTVISYTNSLGNAPYTLRQSGDVYQRSAVLAQFKFVDLPAATTAGQLIYCADCLVPPANLARGALLIANGVNWAAVQVAPVRH